MLSLLASGLAGPTARRDNEKLVPLGVGIDEVEEHGIARHPKANATTVRLGLKFDDEPGKLLT